MYSGARMQEDALDWRTYERIIAATEAEASGIDFSITPNARIIGKVSGKQRQVDVLIDARWGDDLSGRIIVDAKLKRRRIDIRDVESLEAMMKDCRAGHGIIVCANGYTDGALSRAQESITIKLLTAEEADDFSWAAFDPCIGTCNEPARGSKGLVLWDGQHPLPLGSGWAIVFTGKCDTCHEFHIWCWDCGERFALSSEGEYECNCERTWVSMIEEEIEGALKGELSAVHLLMTDGIETFSLDRRALR